MKRLIVVVMLSVALFSCNKKNNIKNTEEVVEQTEQTDFIESEFELAGKSYQMSPEIVVLENSEKGESFLQQLQAEGVDNINKKGDYTIVKMKQPVYKLQVGKISENGEGLEVKRGYKQAGKIVSADFLIVKFPKDVDPQKGYDIIESNGGVVLNSSVKKLRQYHVAPKEIGADLFKLGHMLEKTKFFEYVEPNLIVLPNFDV